MKTQFLTCVCMRLRTCLRTDLIKTQNAFAHKIFQHSNALWVQKLSGCTIRVVLRRYIISIYYLSLFLLYLLFFAVEFILFVHFKNVFRSCIIYSENLGN